MVMNQSHKVTKYTPTRVYGSSLVPATIHEAQIKLTPAQALALNGCNKTPLSDLVLKGV